MAIFPTWAFKLLADALTGEAEGQGLASLRAGGSLVVELVPKQLLQAGFASQSLTLATDQLISLLPWAIFAVFAIDGVFRFLDIYHTRYFSVLVSSELRLRAHEQLLRLDFEQIKAKNLGDHLSSLTSDLMLLQNVFAEVLTSSIKDSIGIVVLGGWLLATNWKLSLVGALVLPLFFFFVSKAFRQLKRYAHKGQEEIAELAAFVADSVQGADTVRLYGLQESRQLSFAQKIAKFNATASRLFLTDASISPSLGLLSATVIGFVVIFFGLRDVYEARMTVGDFSSYLFACVLLYQPLKRLVRVQGQVNQIAGTCQRLFALLALEPKIEKISTLQNHPLGERVQNVNIALKNVSFVYPHTERQVLCDVSLEIPHSAKVALVGHSGSGKSSALKLIPRLYECSSGSIELAGRDIRDWDLALLRAQFAFLSQSTFLFEGSLRDNLLWAKPEASSVQIQAALELAGVDFLANLPSGLDSQIGEGGSRLSGGQRQRLGIALAFLRDAPILILDEPTSALDRVAEEQILHALRNLMQGKTVLLVTHKLDLLVDFDLIYVFSEGQVLEWGKHHELLAKEGHYYRLFHAERESRLEDEVFIAKKS